MRLFLAFSGNPNNSQELSGILGTLNSRQGGDLHACDTDEARGISGRMEAADHGLPGQRLKSENGVLRIPGAPRSITVGSAKRLETLRKNRVIRKAVVPQLFQFHSRLLWRF